MVAVMNNGGGFYRVDMYIHEARMLGATIEAPCVNNSLDVHYITGKTIYLGLGILKALEVKSISRILTTRNQDGIFSDLHDLIHRTRISLEQVTILIRIGAFRFTGKSKHDLLWHAHFFLAKTDKKIKQPELFYVRPKKFNLPEFKYSLLEDAYDQLELLGFPLCDPFELIPEVSRKYIPNGSMKMYLNKSIDMLGYLVTVKHSSTSNRKRMYFGTFLDQAGHFIDTVHFPPVAARYPFRGRGIYHIRGKVVEEFGFYSIEVSGIWKINYLEDPRFADDVERVA